MCTERSLSSADDVVEGEYVEQRSGKRSDRTLGRNWFSLWQEWVSAGAEVNDLLAPAGIWDKRGWDLRETPGQAAHLSHCVKTPSFCHNAETLIPMSVFCLFVCFWE